jgi:hypothetical protein
MKSVVAGFACGLGFALSGCGGESGAGGAGTAAVFRDEASDFETSDVHDADREVVHFDVDASSMVKDGAAVGGWTTQGNDLSWERSSVAFRVRFGTENGERRAYFTETVTGTICDLGISAPDQLSIFATSEFPPEE